MMSSQLGRMILSSTSATEDEMRVRPGEDGDHGSINEYLDEIAAEIDARSTEIGD